MHQLTAISEEGHQGACTTIESQPDLMRTNEPPESSTMPKQSFFDPKMLDRLKQAVTDATSFDEIKSVRDHVAAFVVFAESAGLSLVVRNRAAEIRLRAERRAGELLPTLIAWGGDRRSKSHSRVLKIADLGINHNQASRWRLAASLPKAEFDQYIRSMKRSGGEITSQGLLRLAKLRAGRSRLKHAKPRSQRPR